VPGVRKKNLELLLAQAERNAEAMSAFQQALGDSDPEVRLVAASRVKLELESTAHISPLVVLCELAQGPYNDELRGLAMGTIARRFPDAHDVFRVALHDAAPSVREAAAAGLAKKGPRVETGALTLADTEGGELSLPRDEGALSLATPAQVGRRARR
jgi:hypothetical protein